MERKLSVPTERTPVKRSRKRCSIETPLADGNVVIPSEGYKIIDSCILQQLVNSLLSKCSNCKAKNSLVLKQNNSKRRGMCETLMINCTSSKPDIQIFETSKKVGNSQMIDINLMSVMAATSVAGGITILRRLCTDFNYTQPVLEHPFNNYLKHLVKVSVESAEKSTSDAAKTIDNWRY